MAESMIDSSPFAAASDVIKDGGSKK